jgi:hypothetical protein
MVTIENDGPLIRATNYWQTKHAAMGLCYLSGNAGAWRLLVPQRSENLLDEMCTGTRATIEPSIRLESCWDIVFEDGSDSPFSLTLDRRQVDRAMDPGECRLTVWTELGKELDLPCLVRTSTP